MRAAIIATTLFAAATGATVSYPCATLNVTNPPTMCTWEAPDAPLLASAPAAASPNPCAAGWNYYPDADRSEDQKCYKEVALESFGGVSFAAADAYCRKLHAKSRLLTITSNMPYTQGAQNLLSQVLDSLTFAPVGLAGCFQPHNSPVGAGNTAVGWSWVDETPNTNLKCSNPSSGACESKLWAANTVDKISAPFDFEGVDIGFFESHYLDVCFYTLPNIFFGDFTGGLISFVDGFLTSSFVCKYPLPFPSSGSESDSN